MIFELQKLLAQQNCWESVVETMPSAAKTTLIVHHLPKSEPSRFQLTRLSDSKSTEPVEVPSPFQFPVLEHLNEEKVRNKLFSFLSAVLTGVGCSIFASGFGGQQFAWVAGAIFVCGGLCFYAPVFLAKKE